MNQNLMNGYFLFTDMRCPIFYKPSHKLLEDACRNKLTVKVFGDDYPTKFKVCRNMMYENLSKYSFNTLFGRFVTLSLFPLWSENQKKIDDRFNNLKNELLSNYDSELSKIKENNRKFYDDLWLFYNKGMPNENFIIEVTNHILSSIPSKLNIYEDVTCNSYFWPVTITPESIDLPSYKRFFKEVNIDFLSKINDVSISFSKYKQMRVSFLEKLISDLNYIKSINIFNTNKDVIEAISSLEKDANNKAPIPYLNDKIIELKSLFISAGNLLQ